MLAPELVTKWVCVTEVIDDTGDRFLRFFVSEGATSWDAKGLLQEALDFERSATFRRDIDDDED